MIKKIRLRVYFVLFLSLAIHIVFLSLWIARGSIEDIHIERTKSETITVKLQQLITNQHEQKKYVHDIIRKPASKEAPPAPTAKEWAFASTYALKNSKGYRHTWGKQVRSMMGTAMEGLDQGQVRFRVEIAPNGSIKKVETLWKTSEVAEALALKAINSMPTLPPTPTGEPLIFERTISFTPFAEDDAPIYSNDCLPDPPSFENPFSWDGRSPQEIRKNKPAKVLSSEQLAKCLKQLPEDTIEGVAAHNQRQLDQWESIKLNK